jgi:AraC family transcriptional activator of pyochelin receptor
MIFRAKDETGHYASIDSQYQTETDEPAGTVQTRILVPNPLVPWSITDLTSQHVKITHASSQIKQNVILLTQQAVPTVSLFAQLSGHSLIRHDNQPKREYGSGQCNLVYTPAYEGELRLSGPLISTIAIQLTPAFFGQFLDEPVGCLSRIAEGVVSGRMHQLSTVNLRIGPSVKAILYALLHCPYQGLAKRLFLEAKQIELVALLVDQIETQPLTCPGVLKRADMDKLMSAKEWLDEHFLQPVTLFSLARQVGLNDFKLKRGFRLLFNTTVFSYLSGLRLNHARQLLLAGGTTVAEVADLAGYGRADHFSHAFRTYFGYLPSELMS